MKPDDPNWSDTKNVATNFKQDGHFSYMNSHWGTMALLAS